MVFTVEVHNSSQRGGDRDHMNGLHHPLLWSHTHPLSVHPLAILPAIMDLAHTYVVYAVHKHIYYVHQSQSAYEKIMALHYISNNKMRTALLHNLHMDSGQWIVDRV